MFGIKNYFKGYKYTTSNVVKFGDYCELVKIAKKENRNLKKQRRVERLVVYRVPGRFYGMGQLCILR